MKLTKEKLKDIIKEELAEITEPSYKFAPKADPEFGNRPEDLAKDAEVAKRHLVTDMAYITDIHEGIGAIADKHGGKVAKDIYDALRNAALDHYSRAIKTVQEVGKAHGGDIDEDIYYFFEEFDT
jgi:hypothetical protein